MREWTYKPGRSLRCPFEYPNPEPEPVCTCGEFCECESYWTPTIACHSHPAVRVILDDGRWMDCCSPEAHGVAPVVWWAPIVGPIWDPPFDRVMKYFYRQEDIIELAERRSPFLAMLKGDFHEVRYRGREEGP